MVSDLFSCLVSPSPSLTTAEAESSVERQYGIRAQAEALRSERDQNFLIHAANGEQFVFRIANAADGPDVIDLQARVTAHTGRGAELPRPERGADSQRGSRVLRRIRGNRG